MEQLFGIIQNKKKLFWLFTLFYITFNACFMFPINTMVIDTIGMLGSFVFTFIVSYLMIVLLLQGLLRKKAFIVFLLTLIFTAIGMGFRYILEYGEVSNTVNFTISNILIFLFVIPLLVTLGYCVPLKR